jgi:predicted alpha/beta-hydrolase family hydrolase
MSSPSTEALTVVVDAGTRVSALLDAPSGARTVCVLAHGAGAGMRHPFMASIAGGLAERGVACLRYQFPSMERAVRRPDAPAIAHATVRAAVAAAAQRLPGLMLVAGGKSFGGRMTSQAQAAAPLPAVRGLAFLGFPLHPAGRPGDARAAHLAEVQLPMLFLQGTRDALADLSRLQGVIGRLGPRATLCRFEGADHSFHVPARSGRTDADVLQALLDALVGWIDAQARGIDTAHDDNGRSS